MNILKMLLTMVAAPFKGVLTLRGKSGIDYALPFSASDVAAAFVTFDGTGLTVCQINEAVQLRDMVLTAAGTDTTTLNLFVGGLQAPISFNNASIKNTIPLPRVAVNPWFLPMSQIQLKQA